MRAYWPARLALVGGWQVTVPEFSEPEPNLIASTKGFSVRVLGRTGMSYEEGGRSVWIDSEVLAAPHGIALYKESMRVWEGPEPGPVTDEDRDRIVDNIKRAFLACGYELEVPEPFDWGSVAVRPPEGRRLRHAPPHRGSDRIPPPGGAPTQSD